MYKLNMERVILTVLYLIVSPESQECRQFPEIYSYYHIHKPSSEDDIKVCEMALEHFAQSSSNYTLCTLRNARPIHMCQECVQSYVDLENDHNKILTLETNGTKCKDKLINLDRLQIVESTYMDMKALWERGFCNKCFDWTNGTATLSNDTKTFIEYFDKAKKCINGHIGEDMSIGNDTDKICEDCMNDYLTLNSFYDSLKGDSETIGLCMDIVDSMNATRSIWSGVLNCCKLRKTPEIILMSCTAILTFLPVLFYLATRIYSSETPKIQVIGQHHFEPSLTTIPGPSTSIQAS